MKPILKYALLAVVLASLAIGAILAQRSSLILPGADKKPEKLEAPLKGLVKVRSEGGSVEEYAKAHGIPYEDGKVRVVIELIDEQTEVPQGYGLMVEARYKNMVQALVPAENLEELAKDPAVKLVRTPRPALAAE